MKYAIFTLCLSSLVFLGGCGVKPKDLSAPAGTESSRFPGNYPAPNNR